MRLIRSAHYCVWTLHIACLLNFIPEIQCLTYQRIKRNSDDNFSVLLNLYKMNPLRDSKVFEMFSNTILLPNRADNQGTDAMHFDENESIREKQMRADVNLKLIQDAIHASPSPKRRIGRPEFLVDSFVAEKFSGEIALQDLAKLNLLKPNQDDSYKDIFGHILESDEKTDSIPVTKGIVNVLGPTDVTVSELDVFSKLESNYKAKYSDDSVIIMR